MNDTDFPQDELFPSDSSAALGSALETAATETMELEAPQLLEPDWTGARCEKCTAPNRDVQATVCRQCGWYASLGTFVELDQDWDEGVVVEPAAPQSHLQVWLHLLPWYAWLVIGSVAAVLVASAAVRIVLAESALRTTWSLWQLAIGACLFGLCHLINFIKLTSDNTDTGMPDVIMKPLKIWANAARSLPSRLPFFNVGMMSLAAVVGSFAIIGGLPYERLIDWGIKEPPKQNLMAAVMDQAKKAKGDDKSMEEAVEDFAGKGNVDDLQPKDDKPEPTPRLRTDCVIIGYRAYEEDGRLHTLILAGEFKGKLRYAGNVRPELSDEELVELAQALSAIRMKRSFVPLTGIEANWVKPIVTCRVTFDKQMKDGRLSNMEWRKLLGSIKRRKR